MTIDTAETPVDPSSVDAEALTTPPEVDPSNEMPEPSQGNREARYRTERNSAREEAAALAQRIEALQTRELERIASRSLANPADLLTLSGKALADLLDDDGDVDPVKVQAVADEVLGSRPGLKVNARATDPSQGTSGAHGKRKPTMWDLLKS